MSNFLPHKKVRVSIDGNMLHSFKSLRLHQVINDHHAFEVLLDNEVGEVPKTHSLNRTTGWLGKKLSIFFGGKQFVGIIAQVSMLRSEGVSFLRVSGYSTTYLLESDAHFASWNEKNLESIVRELAERAGVQARVKPEKTDKLEYECQYQESNFGFIQRLAKQHYEWLYFDGLNLVFGKPELEAAIPLDSEKDLQALDICIQTGAKALSAYSHQSGSNNTLSSSSPDEPVGLNNLGSQAFDASIGLFGTPSNHYALARTTNKSALDSYLQKKQQADAAMSHYITAESNYVGLVLGSVVEIKSAIQIWGNKYIEEGIGTYFITEITHYANGDDDAYHCQFTGIPASIKTLPTPNVSLPVAQPQMATVISNEDPKKQGRVQVKMNWQINGMKSSWLRVLSPDAGNSDKVASNRGFVFIPEKGDQVMVAFRYNDPNRPYVQGSLFNGTNASGGGDSNKTKSLTTRSGCTVSLDDSKGSVTISDKDGNVYIADGAGCVSITANKKISLNAGEGTSITIDGEQGTITLTGKVIKLDGEDEISASAKTIAISAQDSASLQGKTVNVSATTELDVSGHTKASLSSMATTEISGTIIKMN